MEISQRLKNTPFSPIRKLVPFAQAAKASGVKVYHLNIGDPDIETPAPMLSALKNSSEKVIHYANSQGEEEMLESLLWYYKKLGFSDLTKENFLVTFGGSEAILWMFLALCNPTDEVIVFEPFYANYLSFAQMSQVNLVPITTKIETGFHFPDKSEIEKKLTKKTRAILLCNPNNPTGTLYSKAELTMIVNLAKKYKLAVLCDEVYREFVYDGKKHYSVLNFNYPQGIFVLDSLSKRYSLCGARIGCIVSRNKVILSQILKFAQARLSVGYIDQMIAAKLTKVSSQYLAKVNEEYRKRRDLVIAKLQKIPGIVCQKPEGAFYIIAKLPVKDTEIFAKWLLTDFREKNETVMVAPAGGFYRTKGKGKDEIRIAYVINRKDLARALDLLSRAIISL